MNNRSTQSRFSRAIKKFFYSAFVTATFIAYALQNRGTAAVASIPSPSGTQPTPAATTTSAAAAQTDAATSTPAGAPAVTAADPTSPATAPAAATATNAPTVTAAAAASSGYKDGTYTGSVVDVRWGYVQVQTTIQGGKITNVQFLQYPNERMTSVRINSNAVPALQQEAIQAQSANVNIITGATLTSEGFQQSLQAALTQAKA